MNLKNSIFAASCVAAAGITFVLALEDRKKIDKFEALQRERDRLNYRRVLFDMQRTRLIVDKVLDLEYGVDFGRAMRDIRCDREFDRIVERFDD